MADEVKRLSQKVEEISTALERDPPPGRP